MPTNPMNSSCTPSTSHASPPPDYTLYPISGGFKEITGPLFVKERDDGRVFGFRAGIEHTNPDGALHGGYLMTVMDDILSIVILDRLERRSHVATVSLNCDFLSPARPGDWVHGSGEITRLGQTLVFVRGALSVGRKGILTASGMWKIFGPR